MPLLLETGGYVSVDPLFQEMNYHLASLTVLAGMAPGRVYVDDPVSPRAAVLLPANRHRIYVAGEPEPRLLADVIHLLYEESHAESYGFVVYYDTSRNWQQAIEHVLQGQESGSDWRQFYRLREPSAQAPAPLQASIKIRRIDESIVGDTTLENRELLIEEIHSESPSFEHFFRQHFGFCALDSQLLVAWCLAEYHYQSRYELGIETIEAYQRQGIATHLTDAVVRQAFAQGATEVGWHCWAANTPSVATALKSGFEKVFDYPVCYGRYRPALL